MNVGIIGLGAISKTHVTAALENGANIVSLCDVNEEKIENIIAKYKLNNCRKYDNYLDMLDNESLDVVHILTPHFLHKEMIVECLKRNINVLTEKPLAISDSELKEIEEEVEKTNAKLGICHQNRYNQSIIYLKNILADDCVESITGMLSWDRNKDYYTTSLWRGKKAFEGGSVSINQALHTIDLVLYLMGMPKNVISHNFNDLKKDIINTEETSFSILEYDNDRRAILSLTTASNYSFPVTLNIKTKKHNILLRETELIVDNEYKYFPNIDIYTNKKEWGSSHVLLIKDFYECIKNNKEFSIDFYEGKKVIDIILKMYK